MASLLSKAWFQNELKALRERVAAWPMPWQVSNINSLLFLREDRDSGCLCVYRRTDNLMVLRMTDSGDIYPGHHGLWEPEFATALGEALILLARIHCERTCKSDAATNSTGLMPAQLPLLARSLGLEAFFDIVDVTAAGVVCGNLSPELWSNSRERYDDCIRWANEFETLHATTEWDGASEDSDYFIAIENFTTAKLAELKRVNHTALTH